LGEGRGPGIVSCLLRLVEVQPMMNVIHRQHPDGRMPKEIPRVLGSADCERAKMGSDGFSDFGSDSASPFVPRHHLCRLILGTGRGRVLYSP
jgi:hypothetical protein